MCQKLLQESIKQISEEIACLEEAKKLKQEEIQKNNLTLKDFSQRVNIISFLYSLNSTFSRSEMFSRKLGMI